MKKVTAFSLVLSVIFVAVVAVNLAQLTVASGACSISWRPGDTTCTVANPTGHFSDSLTTIAASGGHGSWVLYQLMSQNINGIGETNATPATVDMDDFDYDEIDTLCTGELEDDEEEGTAKLNAWDGTYWGCSGSRDFTVKPSGESCN